MNKKLITTLPLLVVLLAGCTTKRTYKAMDYFTHAVVWDNSKDFKILHLCDIHFSQSDYFEEHEAVLNRTIAAANPDMIVLNGDSFTFATKSTVNELFSFIDSKNIPWTYTFGNHDDQGFYNDVYIQRLLGGTTYKNVVFKNIEDDDVTGRSNFVINLDQFEKTGSLVENKGTKFQLYLLDSNSANYDTMKYDFIKQDQIDWYKRMVSYSNKQWKDENWTVGMDAIPSAMFFHIPLPEFTKAWDLYSQNDLSVEKLAGTGIFEYGGPREEDDLGLFDVVKEYKSTKAIFAAHDHYNDTVLKYQDICLCFGVKATDRIYYTPGMIGGQVMTINKDDMSLSFENIEFADAYSKEAK